MLLVYGQKLGERRAERKNFPANGFGSRGGKASSCLKGPFFDLIWFRKLILRSIKPKMIPMTQFRSRYSAFTPTVVRYQLSWQFPAMTIG
jgi:hypothetical protein